MQFLFQTAVWLLFDNVRIATFSNFANHKIYIFYKKC